MIKVRIPTEDEERILRENFLDPEQYGVTMVTESSIHLICYKTRDEVTVRKGDRPWQ